MPRIVIGDGALYYERQGVGFPVMLVSGLSGFASFWADLVPSFAKSFDVVTHDHRGIGQSDLTRSGFTVDRMAADVIGLMDALEIERAHIVGHSTGGAIAQTLAIEHPKRLASIVLSASWTKPDAYFRRFFGLRKDILLRLGPSAYVQSNSLFLYPSWYVARNNERLRQMEAQTLAVFPPTEIAASRIDAILAFDRTEQLGADQDADPRRRRRGRHHHAGLFLRGAGAADPRRRDQDLPARRSCLYAGQAARVQPGRAAVPRLPHAGVSRRRPFRPVRSRSCCRS